MILPLFFILAHLSAELNLVSAVSISTVVDFLSLTSFHHVLGLNNFHVELTLFGGLLLEAGIVISELSLTTKMKILNIFSLLLCLCLLPSSVLELSHFIGLLRSFAIKFSLSVISALLHISEPLHFTFLLLLDALDLFCLLLFTLILLSLELSNFVIHTHCRFTSSLLCFQRLHIPENNVTSPIYGMEACVPCLHSMQEAL